MLRREVASKLRCCKNAWFQEKPREVEVAVRRGRGACKGLREMQRGRLGMRPVRSDTWMVSCVLAIMTLFRGGTWCCGCAQQL